MRYLSHHLPIFDTLHVLLFAISLLSILLVDLLLLLHHHVLLHLLERNFVTILIYELLRLTMLIVETILLLHLLWAAVSWGRKIFAFTWVVELVDGSLNKRIT